MEIIPNWHPIFVHFTIALFSTSALIYLLIYLTGIIKRSCRHYLAELEIVARWCLWLAAFASVFTVSAGFYAFYTIAHNETIHSVMTIHRNWALLTFILILLTALWSALNFYKNKRLSLSFIITLLVAQCFLTITAWYGAELVFRYGAGVKPVVKNLDADHQHGESTKSANHSQHDH